MFVLPAAQVTAQQQSHPTAMGLLLLRYPSPHLSREQHRPPLASSLSGADLVPLLGPAAGMSVLPAEQQPPRHPQWDSLQLGQQHHRPRLQQQQQLSLKDHGGDHGAPPALAQRAGTALLGARTRAFKDLCMYACMDTHGDLQL